MSKTPKGEVASVLTGYPLNFNGNCVGLGEKAAQPALPKYLSNGTTGQNLEDGVRGHPLGESGADPLSIPGQN
jgi:hypothetical protein